VEIARLATAMPADETQLLYSLCLHGRAELGLAPDEYAAMTMVLLRLLAFKPASGSAEKKSLNSAPTKAQPVASTSHAPANQPPPSDVLAVPVREQPEPTASREQPQAVTPTPALEQTTEGDFWYALVHSLVQAEAIAALVRELALQSQLVARDSDTWMLRIERESLNNTSSRERLQAALAQAGHAVRLTVEIGRVIDSPALRNAAAAAQRQQEAQDIILNDPYVQSLMRDFGAKIVPGSIKPA
jgi:DNA polymerase-3 subunit gamma/tau